MPRLATKYQKSTWFLFSLSGCFGTANLKGNTLSEIGVVAGVFDADAAGRTEIQIKSQRATDLIT